MGGGLFSNLLNSKVILSFSQPIVLVLQLLTMCTSEKEYCPVITNSVKVVSSCPISKAGWDSAAYKKNCSKMVPGKNCNNSQPLLYHCVINAYANETLEVCAPQRLITGFCAEYNVVGERVQIHREAKCNITFPKCDRAYKSTDAYKYPDCYALVHKNKILKPPVVPQTGKKAFRDTRPWKESITAVIFLTVTVVLGAIVFFFVRRKCKKDNTLPGPTECERLLNSSDLSEKPPTEDELRIVICGKTGSGKSATGNTILGEKFFKTSMSGSSITKKCLHKSSVRFGYKIVVVDTPGTFDTHTSNENAQEEIFKCITMTSPGPHAFILVLRPERITEEEQNSIEYFVKQFGENIYKYIIVLFTNKDVLDYEGKQLSDYLKTLPDNLNNFINRCDRRVIAFNNYLEGQAQDEQVNELFALILKNLKENESKYFNNKIYNETETPIINEKGMRKGIDSGQEQQYMVKDAELTRADKSEYYESEETVPEKMLMDIKSGNKYIENKSQIKEIPEKILPDKHKWREEIEELQRKGREIFREIRLEIEEKIEFANSSNQNQAVVLQV